jgi:hypothetical protein
MALSQQRPCDLQTGGGLTGTLLVEGGISPWGVRGAEQEDWGGGSCFEQLPDTRVALELSTSFLGCGPLSGP